VSWRPGTPVRIEAPRYVLRSLTVDDASPRYLAWLQDPEVVRWLNARFRSHSLDTIRAYIARHDDRTSFHLGIFTAGDGTHVGNYSVYHEPAHETAQINVMIGDKQHWGAGTVLETRALLVDWLFDTLGVYRVWGTPFAQNAPAVFNYKRQGFRLEGMMRAARKVSDDERLDIAVFAVLRDEWNARRGGGT